MLDLGMTPSWSSVGVAVKEGWIAVEEGWIRGCKIVSQWSI